MCLPRGHGRKGDSAEIGYQGIVAGVLECLRVQGVCAGGQSGCLLAPTARLTWRGGKSSILAEYPSTQLQEASIAPDAMFRRS